MMLQPRIMRTRRRTISLIINRLAELEVRAPLRMPDASIEDFIRQNRAWIDRKIEQVKRRALFQKEWQFENGEIFIYCGHNYSLYLVDDAPGICLEAQEIIFPRRFLTAPKRHLQAWYKQQAQELILPRVAQVAQALNLTYKSANITSARTRWGSCGGGKLHFSWRLVLLAQDLMDYVIYHELNHLLFPDHSSRFWENLTRILPEQQERHERIRQLSRQGILYGY